MIDYVFEGKHGIMNAFVECRFFFGFDKGKKHNDSKSKSQLRLRLRPTQWKKVLVQSCAK